MDRGETYVEWKANELAREEAGLAWDRARAKARARSRTPPPRTRTENEAISLTPPPRSRTPPRVVDPLLALMD